jgi:hypothetical protein
VCIDRFSSIRAKQRAHLAARRSANRSGRGAICNRRCNAERTPGRFDPRMIRWALALWVIGLLTAVPYATHHLLFAAPREQYALLITFVLFWVFGYWGVASPLIALAKIRSLFRAIESTGNRADLLAALRSPETRDVAIDLIATENRVPRFVARRAVDLLLARLPTV